MTGVEALRWRQKALLTDEQSMKTALEKEVQGQVPDGVKVKMNHILALNDSTVTLMAILDVSGNLGTATGKRVFFPAALFETKSKPMFASEKRRESCRPQIPCRGAGCCQDHSGARPLSGKLAESYYDRVSHWR